MTEQEKRDMVLKIAWSYYGKFYKWGGDDPSGFDCSGLAIECLKSVGVLPRSGDWTANGLARKFHATLKAKPGDLVMWFNSTETRVIHVEICIGNGLAIGASGGGSKTKTIADAVKQNAFIKIRPIESRKGPVLHYDPYI